MRGRRPEPTALKQLRGNPGKRPLPAKEPKPQIVAMRPPDWLSDEARAEWDRVAPMLLRLGVLTEADGSALLTYCKVWERWLKAERQLATSGLLLKSKSGYPIVNPLVGIANKTMTNLVKLLTEFGMTPSSRARVHSETDPGDSDPLAEFVHGR